MTQAVYETQALDIAHQCFQHDVNTVCSEYVNYDQCAYRDRIKKSIYDYAAIGYSAILAADLTYFLDYYYVDRVAGYNTLPHYQRYYQYRQYCIRNKISNKDKTLTAHAFTTWINYFDALYTVAKSIDIFLDEIFEEIKRHV